MGTFERARATSIPNAILALEMRSRYGLALAILRRRISEELPPTLALTIKWDLLELIVELGWGYLAYAKICGPCGRAVSAQRAACTRAERDLVAMVALRHSWIFLSRIS